MAEVGGEILYFDEVRGTGFIRGADGNRYVFDRDDAGPNLVPRKGRHVVFRAEGDRARALSSPEADAVARQPVPQASVDRSVEHPVAPVAETMGVWGYFRRAVTSNYANFGGRARRKEFWSFALISAALLIVLMVAGITLDFLVGNMRSVPSTSSDGFRGEGAAIITLLLCGGAGLALVIPWFAVTIRRIHDIGLSGWFILVNFIPSIGSIIILVFTLIPSQRHPNDWGPVPPGIAG